MNGMPRAAVISRNRPATSNCNASDSTTHGPAIRKNGRSRPISKPQSFMSCLGPAVDGRSCRHLLAALGLVLQRGVDERLEERMAAPRRRLELGMELHAEDPRVHVARQLDALGQALALRQCRNDESAL